MNSGSKYEEISCWNFSQNPWNHMYASIVDIAGELSKVICGAVNINRVSDLISKRITREIPRTKAHTISG